MEFDNLQTKIDQKMDEIKSFKIKMSENTSVLPVTPQAWTTIPKSSVQLRACSLNLQHADLNVANVVFEKDGYVGPHKHENAEMIFCIDGTYVDEINGVTLHEGQTQVIPPNTLHSGRSDDALLVVTWKPAFV